MIKLVLKGDQCLWWMDGRWCYYSKYWTNTQQENGLRCTFVFVCSGICMCGTVVHVVFALFMKLFIEAVLGGVAWGCHSPLLDQ